MLQKNFSNSRLFSDHGSLVIRHCRRYRAVVPVLRRILTSALFAFAMLGVATSGAQAKKTLGIGAPGLAAKAAGGPVILVNVNYPHIQSGHDSKVTIRVSGRGIRPFSLSRVQEDLDSGPVRGGDRRGSFNFVHAIPLTRRSLTRLSSIRGRPRVKITARSVLDIEGDGKAEAVATGVRMQVGLRNAPAGMCSSIPRLIAVKGARSRLDLPRCGARVFWKLAEPPETGYVSVSGLQVSYRSGERRGLDSFTLATKGGKVHRRVPVQVRAGSVDPSTVSVRTLGDSVTAGFGYFGTTGRAMILDQLLDCKPGATVYNDACSSNSSNTTNVGSDPNYLPDYGLSRNISWPAVWANSYGITNYKNYAVSGSAPSDWLPGGQFNSTLESIEAENPDYIMFTLGANPLLSDMLFGVDEMGCAIYSDLEGDYEACIESAFASVDLAGKLNSLYTDLVNKTTSKIVLLQYHLSIPSSAIAYTTGQIATMGNLMNEVIAEQAAAVSTSRISVISPPHFNVGIDMDPIYPSKYKCTLFGSKVDGPSVQSTPTQDEFELLDPISFCSGPSIGSPWVISGDTGIHPSFAGYAQMADQIPPPS